MFSRDERSDLKASFSFLELVQVLMQSQLDAEFYAIGVGSINGAGPLFKRFLCKCCVELLIILF
jgi:hypothetical protein